MKRRHESEVVFSELMRNANMHVLEDTTIELPSQLSVVDAGSEIELYLYCLTEKGDSRCAGLGL